ncbi:MAG: sigma-70 family RNA polymerase sigma factor, partial [Acidobacteria bacterium]|nr:sigma-70 family RNA polymerase sigma factor [Acidobacteriota bacterium]
MDAPETDKSPLLPAIAAGDGRAVQELLDRYKGLIWWLARQLVPGPEAEDAVQEVFVELWTHADRYDPSQSSESAFVAMVARRRFIDRRRRSGRR